MALSSWLVAVYAITRIMLVIPFSSWFPFGIWNMEQLKNLLGAPNAKYLLLVKRAFMVFATAIVLSIFILARKQ
jgi:hypothetical protein